MAQHKLQATITFIYEANTEDYVHPTPEHMARSDQLAFYGNTEYLLETLAPCAYTVLVQPVEKFDKLEQTP